MSREVHFIGYNHSFIIQKATFSYSGFLVRKAWLFSSAIFSLGKGGRTGPIDMGSDIAKQLGIDETLQKLSRVSGGRPVNAMIFETPGLVKAKGKGIRIPAKCGG